MNRQQRNQIYDNQARAFTEGTAEYMNGQWIFIDEETGDASPLEEYLSQEMEVFRLNRWRRGVMVEPGKLSFKEGSIFIRESDRVRVKRDMIYSLEMLLDAIHDDAFVQFVTTLNSLNFSLFDCLYCYNHLNFLAENIRKSGVNLMIFDNQEEICSVQHHFYYYEKETDRFEFTLNTGRRLIIEKLRSS